MKNLEKYKIFEAKVKKNWTEITHAKLSEFKQMIDNNPIMKDWNNNEVLNDLLINLKDIAGVDFDISYCEDIRFTCDDDWIQTEITENGEISSRENPYLSYTRITKWLDKKRIKGKEIESYYLVYFRQRFRTDEEYRGFVKSEKYDQWKEEVESTKQFLKSLGFEISGDVFDFRASIKLEKTEEVKKKTLDLSDIVPENIVDDFEKFILKRGLTRSDAEEIAKIFTK